MRNIIPKGVPALLEKTGVVIAGLTEYGATIGLVRHTKDSVTAKLTNLILSVGGHTEKKATRHTKTHDLRALAITARKFGMQVRDSLKPIFGNVYSAAWDEVGFVGSLEVSLKPAELKALMLAIKAYLTRNQGAENAQANITAIRADALSKQLTTAIDGVATAKYNAAKAFTIKRNAIAALKATLRGVINELSEEIDSLSDYWLRFGFNKPGAKERPEAPTNLVAVSIGASAALKWDRSERAERYRVYKKVVGVDEDFIAVETREDLDYVLEGLPANATIEIAISAVNTGGESAKSGAVIVQTG